VKILILKPGSYSLNFSFYSTSKNRSLLKGKIENYRCSNNDRMTIYDTMEGILRICLEQNRGSIPDAIALYGRYGGELFTEPTPVDEESIERLRDLIPGAPLQIPGLLALIDWCRENLPGTPMVLLFGTSFFTSLSPREKLYGLNPELAESMKLQRSGFHGLFHEDSVKYVLRRRKKELREGTAKTLSICLEPRPELAAVLGKVPQITTSGTTPLEGLPGHTTCGEIDPSIALVLSRKMGWGPEQIDALLTRESGLYGLTGDRVDFDRVFLSGEEDCLLAREVLQYRFLLACGSGVAAMSGVNAIVFSGRYMAAAGVLSQWLLSREFFQRAGETREIDVFYNTTPLEGIIAGKAGVTLLENQPEPLLV